MNNQDLHPTNFPQANRILQKPKSMTDKECGPLPIWTDNRTVISCWKIPWRARLQLLVKGRIWLGLVTGQPTQCPAFLTSRIPIEEQPDNLLELGNNELRPPARGKREGFK